MPAPRFPELPSAARRRTLASRLSAWFAEHQRDLPWRRTRDPYAIWISEAMLQQTRVETVIPYWERFLDRLPDVEALAAADVDDVLSLWSGLGYYRRARALHQAAGRIVEEHGGAPPRSREGWLALPGVGPYTAGAVLSIAFDQPVPLVDGNVERVFARLFSLAAPPDDAAFRRHVWMLAEHLVVDADSPRLWNQGLMELGATVCTPRDPSCAVCPLARSCSARRDGRTADFPLPKARRAPVEVALEILVVSDGGRWLVWRRPEGGRMAGLLEFPTRECGSPASGLFPAAWPAPCEAPLLRSRPGEEDLGEVRHSITHHRIRARLVPGEVSEPQALGSRFSWVSADEGASRALTGMARKVLRRLAAPRA